MNLPKIESYEDQAIDAVASIINKAKESLGERQTLLQLANTRNLLTSHATVSLGSLRSPLVLSSEAIIADIIERKWRLTEVLMYTLKYVGLSTDHCSQYYYFQAIFSQPTVQYPIPQATVTVFFKVAEKHIEPMEYQGIPELTFRIEGQNMDHNIRFTILTADWILAVLKMKIKLFKRIEELKLF